MRARIAAAKRDLFSLHLIPKWISPQINSRVVSASFAQREKRTISISVLADAKRIVIQQITIVEIGVSSCTLEYSRYMCLFIIRNQVACAQERKREIDPFPEILERDNPRIISKWSNISLSLSSQVQVPRVAVTLKLSGVLARSAGRQ